MWKQESYQKAIDFAARKHGTQEVPGKGYNYIVHLCNVAAEAGRAMFEEAPDNPDLVIQAALLHDVIEDTAKTPEEKHIREKELVDAFGDDVAVIVRALTKEKNSGFTKSEQMVDSLDRIITAGKPAVIVKLCDRITNLQPPPSHWGRQKCAEYLQEAELIYSKLADFHGYLGKRLKDCMIEYIKYC